MKWKKEKVTENKGENYVRQIVTNYGGIYRKIHLEDDIGLDGVIEFVENEEATGRLIAVQIKSGDSYLKSEQNKFVVSTNNDHLRYWQQHDLPVVLICYSPSLDLAAWQDVKWYAKYLKRKEVTFPKEKVTIASIEVPFKNAFNEQALSGVLYQVATEYSNERFLFEKANMLLSNDANKRYEGLLYLWVRKEALVSRLLAFLSFQLILDDNLDIVRLSARMLGYCVALRKWSFYPDFDISDYASYLCATQLKKQHVRRLMECVEDGDFGPMSLGEACVDCINCLWGQDAVDALREIVGDKEAAMYTRANALFVLAGCEWDNILDDKDGLREAGLDDVFNWMVTESSNETA